MSCVMSCVMSSVNLDVDSDRDICHRCAYPLAAWAREHKIKDIQHAGWAREHKIKDIVADTTLLCSSSQDSHKTVIVSTAKPTTKHSHLHCILAYKSLLQRSPSKTGLVPGLHKERCLCSECTKRGAYAANAQREVPMPMQRMHKERCLCLCLCTECGRCGVGLHCRSHPSR